MKQLIIASLVAASSAAMAINMEDMNWGVTTVVNGTTIAYEINPKTAQQVGTGNDAFWTAKLAVTVDGDTLVVNVVVDGCDKTPAAGSTALLNDDGKVVAGTVPSDWSSDNVKAGTGKVSEVMASYTCLASILNTPEGKEPAVKGHKSRYTGDI